jgi:Fe2+ or Zn2+ uptake regulation protein
MHPMASGAQHDAAQALRDSGLRNTRCRRAMLILLREADEPLTVEQIADRLAADGFDVSTIYRNVESFDRHGLVSRVDFGDDVRRYCARDGHHHHIRCLRCGRIDSVETCLIERMEAAIRRRLGYSIVGHSLVFTGLCRDCRRAPRSG